MAKRRRKRRVKKQAKQVSVLFIFCVFLFCSVLLLRRARDAKTIDFTHLPQNSQGLTGVALGIDVSEWQRDIDWEAVKDDGYSFAIIRSSFGIDQTQDEAFIQNVEGAKDAGLNVGAYHYSHATTVEQAKWEADYVIELLDDYRWEYPIYYDIETEQQNHLSQEELTEIALTFLNKLDEAGYEVGIYAAESWFYHRLDMNALQNYEVWVASYTDFLDFDKPYQMWQYTQNGKVAGISGDVDINIAYYDYPQQIKSARKNNY